MKIKQAREYVLCRLRKELKHPYLYHNAEHTEDVVDAVLRLSGIENVSQEDTDLIHTAALFHDSGMLETYVNHEEASVRLIQAVLPQYDYSTVQIGKIGKMIMATKLPQFAESPLEKILCDADLDYLGRDDFFMIGLRLQYEWNLLNYKKTTLKEWYKIQIEFLTSHQYFTQAAIGLRQSRKMANLAEIKEICSLNSGNH